MPSFLFRKLQLITVLLLIRNSYTHKVHLFKTVFELFHFRFCFIFIKVYIKMRGLFTLKRHNSFQN